MPPIRRISFAELKMNECKRRRADDRLDVILKRTGYSFEISSGQRMYGGPPPGRTGPNPRTDSEIFCGNMPKFIFECDLIPLFEKCGEIWDLRIIMDPITTLTRGFCFVSFVTKEAAHTAVQRLNDYEIIPGHRLRVKINIPNCRLFIGNIPRTKQKDEIFTYFKSVTPDLLNVTLYNSPTDSTQNKGFCFLEYASHKTAYYAKRRIATECRAVWGCKIAVNWADPEEPVEEDYLNTVKTLYVRNLMMEATEPKLYEYFESYGKIEFVKKIKDYAFINFESREDALKALQELNGKEMCGSLLEIKLANPPLDREKKAEIEKARKRRMLNNYPGSRGSYNITPSVAHYRGGNIWDSRKFRDPRRGPDFSTACFNNRFGNNNPAFIPASHPGYSTAPPPPPRPPSPSPTPVRRNMEQFNFRDRSPLRRNIAQELAHYNRVWGISSSLSLRPLLQPPGAGMRPSGEEDPNVREQRQQIWRQQRDGNE